MVLADPARLVPETGVGNYKNRYQPPLLSRLTTIKQWFKGAGKRSKARAPSPNVTDSPPASDNIDINKPVRSMNTQNLSTPPNSDTKYSHATPARNGQIGPPHITTQLSGHSQRRLSSHSPSPITPQSYRRGTANNTRGRLSTSSSVSSVRSSHAHHHSHSKASSISSNSIESPHISSSNVVHRRSIPGTPVKVLPAPRGVTATIPGNIRVRAGPPGRIGLPEATTAFTGLAPPSPGIIFAKRKRTPFKGPMLAPVPQHRRRSGTGGSGSRNGSVQGRASEEIIEDIEEVEEEVEEVDYFSPVTGPGEFVVDGQL